MNDQALVEHCRESITKGSKTFVFASRFFGRQKMEDAALLYQWCRYCDDAIDQAPKEQQAEALGQLRRLTTHAVQDLPVEDLSFRALQVLVGKHAIPAHYPLELIEGMAMDADFTPPADMNDLLLYCYRVAGVVGLMMAHVMGISDERALKNACDLGLAMQLTNIARDVMADHKLGRCYLPADLLARHGLNHLNYGLIENRGRLALVVRDLLQEADRHYQSGQEGTRFLSAQSALVILIARFTYARIGAKVIAAGPAAWDQRQFTTASEKLLCLAKASAVWFGQLFFRRGWEPTRIHQVWRLQ